jgi:hypothetical protein
MTPTEQVFDWIEHTDLSLWIAGDSMLAFPAILTAHVLGTGFLAGTSSAIALRILGVARQVPLGRLELFYPIMWVALATNAVSGTLLLIGYPYKAFTNPLFYVKLLLIALAVYLVVKIRNEVLLNPQANKLPAETAMWRHARILVGLSLACWMGLIAAGRFLAYTTPGCGSDCPPASKSSKEAMPCSPNPSWRNHGSFGCGRPRCIISSRRMAAGCGPFSRRCIISG